MAADTHRLIAARLAGLAPGGDGLGRRAASATDADPGTLALLRELKRQVHELVDQRKQLGFPVPDGCEAWWTGYEIHGH